MNLYDKRSKKQTTTHYLEFEMNITRNILFKSFVWTYYKQNAGLFGFLIFFMVASVGRANGVGLLEYHFTLIRAMLTDGKFLTFVMIAWLLYALKCDQFFSDKLKGKDYAFLSALNTKKTSFIFPQVLLVQLYFLLPVMIYAVICIWLGITHHWYVYTISVSFFMLALWLAGAWRYSRMIRYHGIKEPTPLVKFHLVFPKGFYLNFMARYLTSRLKMLFLAIKIFSCLFLFGLLHSQTGEDHDLKMLLLFYSFALLGHGVLIYKIRQMEETHLGFYRGLPVSLSSRFMQYALFYLMLFVPEIVIFFQLSPAHLDYPNALLLIFYGWGTLLLLNSLLFIKLLRPFDYLKIISGIYLTVFIAVLTGLTIPFTICLFLTSLYIFYAKYYQFEKA